MPFFIAPLDFGWDIELGKTESQWPYPDVSDYIPWDLVVYAAEQHLVPLRTETLASLEEDINDAIIQDWFTEYTKRYDCLRVRSDLNPLTPLEGLNVRACSTRQLWDSRMLHRRIRNLKTWLNSARPREEGSKDSWIMHNP